jgi:hypothetical protein
MMPVRRFPFGHAPVETPAAPRAEGERTDRLPGLRTVPLADFQPPANPLPFRAPPPPAPAKPFSLVPQPPRRASAPSRVSLRTVATIVLAVLNVVVIGYLVATWGR